MVHPLRQTVRIILEWILVNYVAHTSVGKWVRVATAQGKQAIWFLLFPDRKHREFCSDTGKNLPTQGKYLPCDY